MMVFTTILDFKSELDKSKGIFSKLIKRRYIKKIKNILNEYLEDGNIPCNFFYDFVSFVYCTMDQENNINKTKIQKVIRHQLDNDQVYYYSMDILYNENTILHIKPYIESTLIEIEIYDFNTLSEQKSTVQSIMFSTSFDDLYSIGQIIKDYTIDYLKGVL